MISVCNHELCLFIYCDSFGSAGHTSIYVASDSKLLCCHHVFTVFFPLWSTVCLSVSWKLDPGVKRMGCPFSGTTHRHHVLMTVWAAFRLCAGEGSSMLQRKVLVGLTLCHGDLPHWSPWHEDTIVLIDMSLIFLCFPSSWCWKWFLYSMIIFFFLFFF